VPWKWTGSLTTSHLQPRSVPLLQQRPSSPLLPQWPWMDHSLSLRRQWHPPLHWLLLWLVPLFLASAAATAAILLSSGSSLRPLAFIIYIVTQWRFSRAPTLSLLIASCCFRGWIPGTRSGDVSRRGFSKYSC